MGNLAILTSALRVLNPELPTALSSHNFLSAARGPFACVSLKFRPSITLCPPNRPLSPTAPAPRVAGASPRSPGVGPRGPGRAGCPRPPPTDSP